MRQHFRLSLALVLVLIAATFGTLLTMTTSQDGSLGIAARPEAARGAS